MRSISRWYCSASKEERLKSQFVAIIEYPFVPESKSPYRAMARTTNGMRLSILSPTFVIIAANVRRRNGFCYDFTSAGKNSPVLLIDGKVTTQDTSLHVTCWINPHSTDKSALYGSSLEFFLRWAWQPQAAMPTAEKNVRAAAGGEESRKEKT